MWDLVDESSAPGPAAPRAGRASSLPWIAAVAGLLAAVAVSVHDFTENAVVPADTARFQMSWPTDGSAAADMRGARFFQLSPDGRHMLMVSRGALWVRALDSLDARPPRAHAGRDLSVLVADSESIRIFLQRSVEEDCADRRTDSGHLRCAG